MTAEVMAAPLLAKLERVPPVKIDTILTKDEFLALTRHMMNENPISHFLAVWRGDDGSPKYAKANPAKRSDTIIGKAKIKTALGLYPKNQNNQSTWGALDFDAHSGDHQLAKDRAIKAFSLVLMYRDRYSILCASGRGYHVFVLANELRPL